MYYMGLDLGSLSCDAVLIDQNKGIMASSVVPTGAKNNESIQRAGMEVLRAAGIDKKQVKATVSTGYGRDRVSERVASVTEITCHAKGACHLDPEVRLLIDIGGQDSKAILLDDEGRVADFAMNDKCAAGTGRFLEAMARALQVDITQLRELDLGAEGNVSLSSMCTVFAESEVVSLIADGVKVNEIVSGLNRSIASRVISLVKRVCPRPNGIKVAMSGGVARNSGVVRAISKILDKEVVVPDKPDTVGAFGAALIALERASKTAVKTP